MNTRLITFQGRDRRNIARVGQKAVWDVAVFVEHRYAQGWRELTVHDKAGAEIGGITRHPAGRRVWWAESTQEVAS